MILKDFIFRFPTRTFSKRDGLCRVRIFNDREGKQIVLITDIGNKNPSSLECAPKSVEFIPL